MSRQELDDYRWLVSEAARSHLNWAAEQDDGSVRTATRLRQRLSQERARLVLDQLELRRRGRAKFQRAGQMFFTRRLLEQATDEEIASYKASRIPAGMHVTDLCCGIGGDLAAFSTEHPSLGVDKDPVAALLAQTNCRRVAAPASTEVADAAAWRPSKEGAWHLDPDRRTSGARSTALSGCSPGRDTIEQIMRAGPCGVVKLAPATDVPREWRSAEREWIGSRGECRQQAVWLGSLAKGGLRTATLVSSHGVMGQIQGGGDETGSQIAQPAEFVLEPHSVVLAAGLTAALMQRHQLARFSSLNGYLTGPRAVTDALLTSFAVQEVLSLDVKRIGQVLRHRKIGQLEIKHRGLPFDPIRFRRQLKLRGDRSGVLLLVVQPGNSLAILAER